MKLEKVKSNISTLLEGAKEDNIANPVEPVDTKVEVVDPETAEEDTEKINKEVNKRIKDIEKNALAVKGEDHAEEPKLVKESKEFKKEERKELGIFVNKLRENKIKHTIKRSVNEGYRYLVEYLNPVKEESFEQDREKAVNDAKAEAERLKYAPLEDREKGKIFVVGDHVKYINNDGWTSGGEENIGRTGTIVSSGRVGNLEIFTVFADDERYYKGYENFTFNATADNLEFTKEVNESKEPELPKEVEVSIGELAFDGDFVDLEDSEISDLLSDYLSDTYGFCHKGFKWKGKEGSGDTLVCYDIDWDTSESLKESHELEKDFSKKDAKAIVDWWKEVEDANIAMKWGYRIDNGDYDDIEGLHSAMYDMLGELKEKGASDLFNKGKKLYNKYAWSKYNESLKEEADKPEIDLEALEFYVKNWSEGDNITVTADLLNVLEQSLEMAKKFGLKESKLNEVDLDGDVTKKPLEIKEPEVKEPEEDDEIEYDRRAVEKVYGLEDGELDGVSIRDAEKAVGEEAGALDRFIESLKEAIDTSKEIWEGWTVQDFIDELEPSFEMCVRNQSIHKPFKNKEELKKWCMSEQPYYKKYIPEVVEYFDARIRNEFGGYDKIGKGSENAWSFGESTKKEEGFISGVELSHDEINALSNKLYEALRSADVSVDECWASEPMNNLVDVELIAIIDGDWKHDHLLAEHVLEEFAKQEGFTIAKHTSQEIGDSESDWYEAEHHWDLIKNVDGKMDDTVNAFKQMFKSKEEESLEESKENPTASEHEKNISKIRTYAGLTKYLDKYKDLYLKSGGKGSLHVCYETPEGFEQVICDVDRFYRAFQREVNKSDLRVKEPENSALKESFEEIYIKYWEDEELRDQGISEIYRDNFATREEAIEVARKLVDRDGFASVEVFVSPSGTIESEDDQLIWGYDGIDTWGLGKKEEESLEKTNESDDLTEDVDIHVEGNKVTISDDSGEEVGIIPIDPEKEDNEDNEDDIDLDLDDIDDDISWVTDAPEEDEEPKEKKSKKDKEEIDDAEFDEYAEDDVSWIK